MKTIQKTLLFLVVSFLKVDSFSKEVRKEQTVSYLNVRSFYNWFFLKVRTLHVVNLKAASINIESSSSHLDDLLISLSINRRNVQIWEYIVEEDHIYEKTYSDVPYGFENVLPGSLDTDEDEVKLRLYADFNRGFILVAPTVISALNYIKDKAKSRRFYHRDISIFLIANPSCENRNLEHQIFLLLKTAWESHGLLDIIIQTICNFTYKFFVYRPLKLHNGSYGMVEWYHLKDVLKNPKLTLNSLKTLNNIPLRVNIFYRYPTAVEVSKPVSSHVSTCFDVLEYSNYVGGVDGCTLGHLAKHLNFTAVVEDMRGQGVNRFGHILPNGSATGSLGDVIDRRIDIAMNGVFLEYKYANFNVEFSQVTQSHKICPVVPKSGKLPPWASILRVFSTMSWICIVILAAIMCLLVDLLSAKATQTLYDVLFKSVSAKASYKLKYRAVLAAYLFVFHVILAGIFNGHLFRNFSAVSYYPDISSLQDLAETDLSIETTLNILNDHEKDSETMRKLAGKVVKNYYGTSPAIERAAFYKNIVALEREEEAFFKIHTKYLDQDGTPLLYVLDDCIMTQFVSKILPEGSPFLLVFNLWFSRFQESGLAFKWLTSFFAIPKYRNIESPSLGLDKLVLVFGILLIGLIVSFLVFVAEMAIHRMKVMKRNGDISALK